MSSSTHSFPATGLDQVIQQLQRLRAQVQAYEMTLAQFRLLLREPPDEPEVLAKIEEHLNDLDAQLRALPLFPSSKA
jgi:anti-sigma-K factor RskA